MSFSEAKDKFSSYRPYPYVFLHGRFATGEQWGMQCSDDKGLGDSVVHDADVDKIFPNVPTCKVMDKFWKNKGYGQALYDEFMKPFECDASYRTGPDGNPIERKVTGKMPKEKFQDGKDAPRYPPKSCPNDEFYVDFEQMDPLEKDETKVRALPADTLPQYDIDKPNFWGKHLLSEDKTTWNEADEAALKGMLPPQQMDKASFNHAFIEAYNGDGSRESPEDREVLSSKWGKPTLVDIARRRIQQVLDEYYQDDQGAPNWACDPTKKVVLVGYSTGVSVAGGVIAHDQGLKQKSDIKTWCNESGTPTAGNEKNARELLSRHIAYVVGHNPVVAGSKLAPGETKGNVLRHGGLPIWLPAGLYLAARDVTGFFGLAWTPVWQMIGGSVATTASVGLEVWIKLFTDSKAPDRLAEDLAWSSSYHKNMRDYNVPPQDAVSGEKIKYKTIATHNWAWPLEYDLGLIAFGAVNAVGGLFTGNYDMSIAGGIMVGAMVPWMLWNDGTDIVLESDEDVTSGKAIHKDALTEHITVPNLAHAPTGLADAAYPFHPRMWAPVRKFLFEKPQINRVSLLTHKCINHVGEFALECDEFSPGSGKQIDLTAKVDKTMFYGQMAGWLDGDGKNQQAELDLTGKDTKELIRVNEGGGPPLAYMLSYNSNLMASDTVLGYVNGESFPLRFRKDYGFAVDGKTHSGIVRIPLTLAVGDPSRTYGLPDKWGQVEAGLRNGGNIVGFWAANPAGRVMEKRLIYYDKVPVVVNPNDDITAGPGQPPILANYRNLNLADFIYRDGIGNPEIKEVHKDKGILFSFKTDIKPVDVSVKIYSTNDRNEIDRTGTASFYALDKASMPGGTAPPVYDPFGAESGKIFLTKKYVSATPQPDPHQFFFWVKPQDLKKNKTGAIEGLKHLLVQVDKPMNPGETESNHTFFQVEFAIDNTAPANAKVFAPMLVRAVGGKGYSDRDGDGTLDEESKKVCGGNVNVCDPGYDGRDNDGDGIVDNLGEVADIAVYSQRKDGTGVRLNNGIPFRMSIEDNLQDVHPYAGSLDWSIRNPAGEVIYPTGTPEPSRYIFGTVFQGYYPIPDLETTVLPDGLYSIWYKVVDQAGNMREEKATSFLIDNTPPAIGLVSAPGEKWKGNLSARPQSIFQTDSYASTDVTVNEEARVEIRLVSESGGGIYVINSTISPNFLNYKTGGTGAQDAQALLIYDNFDFLQIKSIVAGGNENQYRRLPEGRYTVTVTATDKAGNSTGPIAALGTAGSPDFIVDRLPLTIAKAATVPFFVSKAAMLAGTPTLDISIDQGLESAQVKSDRFKLTIKLDGAQAYQGTETFVAGQDRWSKSFPFADLIAASDRGTLKPGQHVWTLEVSELDGTLARNSAFATAPFLYQSWDVAITAPEKGKTIGSIVPIVGRVGDPDIEDASPFHHYRLSYVSGLYEDNPSGLPGNKSTGGLNAVASQGPEGTLQVPQGGVLGYWDTRQATSGAGDFTLILEGFDAAGKSVRALRNVRVDNSRSYPPASTTLLFTGVTPTAGDQAVDAGFELKGKPTQVILSIFDKATGALVNKKEALSSSQGFDATFFPPQDKAVVGSDGTSLLIRFSPGSSNLFAFMIKGLLEPIPAYQVRFFNGSGVPVEASTPGFLQPAGDALEYSPLNTMLPEGARTVEVAVPLEQLKNPIHLAFGNSLYDIKNPQKAVSKPLAPGSIYLGTGQVKAASNQFFFNPQAFLRWNLNNALGEEVPKGEYLLKLEGYTQDQSEHIAATPSERTWVKTKDPVLKIANAFVSASVITPILDFDRVRFGVGLSFSVSRSAYVSVRVFKEGALLPIRQTADRVLVLGGYNRVIDFLGWNAEYGTGEITFEPGSRYHFEIVAEAKDNASDACKISPDEFACYDAESSEKMDLQFTIGQPVESQSWDGKEFAPYVLTSRADAPIPNETGKMMNLQPSSSVGWTVAKADGRFYPPLDLEYTVQVKGRNAGLQVGYQLDIVADPATEWNYIGHFDKVFERQEGGSMRRVKTLAVKKDWGNGQTVSFYGPSLWHIKPSGTDFRADVAWNNQESGSYAGNHHLWVGDCDRAKLPDYTNANIHCQEFPTINPARKSFGTPLFQNLFPDDWAYTDPYPGWMAEAVGDGNFIQAGHWDTKINGVDYSEFGINLHSSADGGSDLFMTFYRAGLDLKQSRQSFEIRSSPLPPDDQDPLMPNTPSEFQDLAATGLQSLMHARRIANLDVWDKFQNRTDPQTFRFGSAFAANLVDLEDSDGSWGCCLTLGEIGEFYDMDWFYLGDSKDYFTIKGTLAVKLGGSDPVSIPLNETVKLDNQAAFLGTPTTPPSDYLPLHTGLVSLREEFGTCMGDLKYDLYWSSENKPYRIRFEWVPDDVTPGCDASEVEKTATSPVQKGVLRTSPRTVSGGTLDKTTLFPPYSAYLFLTDARDGERDFNLDAVINTMRQGPLKGYDPVAFPDGKYFRVNVTKVSTFDGVPVSPSLISQVTGTGEGHNLTDIRLVHSGTGPDPVQGLARSFDSEDKTKTGWGAFRSRIFSDPAEFDTWPEHELRQAFCQTKLPDGTCSIPVPDGLSLPTARLYSYVGGNFVRNPDVRLDHLQLAVTDAKGESNKDVVLGPDAIWTENTAAKAYDLNPTFLNKADALPLALSVRSRVFSPKRFLAEQQDVRGGLPDLYSKSYHYSSNVLAPLRPFVYSGERQPPFLFDVADAAGPLMHRVDYIRVSREGIGTADHVDLKSYRIGTPIDFRNGRPETWSVSSAQKRIHVRFQQPGSEALKGQPLVAEVVPVDLNKMAAKLPSGQIPYLDNPVAPGFILYPEVMAYESGLEPVLTYFLRRDELSYPGNPGGALTADRLLKLYALNPSNGDLTDITAYVTLMKKNAGGTGLTAMGCHQTDAGSTLPNPDPGTCVDRIAFADLLADPAWQYVKLTAQPRFQAGALPGGGALLAASAAGEPYSIHQLAYLPMFENAAQPVYIQLDPKPETAVRDVDITGRLIDGDGQPVLLGDYGIQFGHGYSAITKSFSQIVEAGTAQTVKTDAQGRFTLPVRQLFLGENTLFARVSEAGPGGPALPGVTKASIRYFDKNYSIETDVDPLVSNIADPEVRFRIRSYVSGNLEITIYDEKGAILKILNSGIAAEAPTSIPWNPQSVPGIGMDANLTYVAVVRSSTGVSAASLTGKIRVDLLEPHVELSQVGFSPETLDITGKCADGDNQTPLANCGLRISGIDVNNLLEYTIRPESSGDFRISVPLIDVAEQIEAGAVFYVDLSGSDAVGNTQYATTTARMEAGAQPLIEPKDLAFPKADFTPVAEAPAGGTLQKFHQGRVSDFASPIGTEGVHVLSAFQGDGTVSGLSAVSVVALDKTAPIITQTGLPQEGERITAPFRFRVDIRDAYLKSGTVSVVSDNGSQVHAMEHSDDAFDLPVEQPGHYRIAVQGTDVAGNASKLERSFNFDRGVPQISTDIAENGYAPVVGGEILIYWSVLEDRDDFVRTVTASLGGAVVPVIYTDFLGRSQSVNRFLSRIPIDAAQNGSGSIGLTVSSIGEADANLVRQFRYSQTGPVLVSASPSDGSTVPRTFDVSYQLHADVGLERAELTLPDGSKIASGPLLGVTDYVLTGRVVYTGTPLGIELRLSVTDKAGQSLSRTLRYNLFDFQVLIRDNSFGDATVSKPQIKLANYSTSALTGMTVRLWLSRQEFPWADIAVDAYVKNPCGILTKVRVHERNANLVMVDIVYPADYTLPPGAQTPESGFQAGLHFRPKTGGSWAKGNDWSWAGVNGSFQLSRNVTVYDNTGRLIYGTEPDPDAIPNPGTPPPPAEKPRVTSSLQAVYLFHEGFGEVASDISGNGIPLDLQTVGQNARWIPTGGIDFSGSDHNSILENRTPNKKLYESAVKTGRISLEAWIEPANVTQSQARIFEYGSATGAMEWNWGMVQTQKNLEFRLRTTNSGVVSLATTDNPLTLANASYHLVMTYQAYDAATGTGGMRIYVNGRLSASNKETGAIAGSGTNRWSSDYILTMGNHAGALDRDWAGRLKLVGIHSKSLSQTEVSLNYAAGVVEPLPPEDMLLGVVCGDRILPLDIVDGSRDWQEDKTADGRQLTMGKTIYAKGIGGQPQSNGNPAWLVYDLEAEKSRLGLANKALRLTGFLGKQDGSAALNTFVKTSVGPARPSDNEWLNNSGSVVQRFNTADASNFPLNLDIRNTRWLMLGANSALTGTNLHAAFGDVKLRFGSVPEPVYAQKLVYRYYQAANMDRLPDFDTMVPMKSGYTDEINLAEKLQDDNFAMEFVGFLKMEAAGTYTFYSSSDDGSRVFVDGIRVVDNDGVHATQERSGQIVLGPGYHALKIQYFDRAGGEFLEVKYQGPGLSKRTLPANALFHSESFGYGLETKYFEGTWNTLPTFEALSPVGTDIRNAFRITPRALNDAFGFTFEGNVFLPVEGSYTFFTSSDDGSQLFLDGKKVLDNDGQHPMQERSGTLSLTAGFHWIRVVYFDRSGGEGLEVKFQGPGIAKTAIPSELLFGLEPQAATPNLPGKGSVIVMEGQSVDRNYTMTGSQWFKIPLSNYANTWASTIFVSLDDMDQKLMEGNFKFENGPVQGIDGWYEYYTTGYTGQNEIYFNLEIPGTRTYKVRWWFQ